jgi:hypothetical protein
MERDEYKRTTEKNRKGVLPKTSTTTKTTTTTTTTIVADNLP